VRNNGTSISSVTSELDTQVSNLDNMWTLATPSYTDQVLPFNVTLTGANEYGAMTAGKILGIEILNEGSGISVDDAVSEAQATFVARAVEPMQAVQSNFISTVGGNNQVSSSCRTTKPSRAREEGRQPVPGMSPALLPVCHMKTHA
jgi:hypothetical protein